MQSSVSAPGSEPTPPASGSKRSAWSWILGGALSAVLLYFSLRGIQWGRVWELILTAHWQFLAMGMAISLFTYFLRSLRWRVLLTASADFSVAMVFWANMAGYLGNNLLPARAGELIRTVLVSSRSSLTKTYVLTTALTERLFDALVLVLCGSIVLLRVTPKPHWMDEVSRPFLLIGVLGMLFVIVLPRMEHLLFAILGRIPLPPAIRTRVEELVRQVILGLRSFHSVSRFLQFAAFTVLIWTADTIGVTVVAHVFDLHVSMAVALLLLVGLGLGSGLPSTPGYVGIYQFVAVSVLTPFGIDRNAALALIIVTQAAGYVLLLIVGSIGLWQLRDLLSESRP